MGKSDLDFAQFLGASGAIYGSAHLIAALFILARLLGFFALSPLFAGKSIPVAIRLGLAIGCSLFVAPPLLTKVGLSVSEPLLFALSMLKEVVIGYLLGWIFSLLMEAAAFAGQFVGTLMGLSATELLIPQSNSEHPLLSRFFLLFTFVLFLALDLHHPLLQIIFESYQTIPLPYPFTQKTAQVSIELTNLLFHHALAFALFPLTFLLSLIALFAILSRFMPIFWIGFPLQLLVGLSAVALSLKYFIPLLEHAFFQTLTLFKELIY